MKIAAPSFLKSTLDAEFMASRIQQLADELAEAMRDVHGGTWRCDINHEIEFILIRRS